METLKQISKRNPSTYRVIDYQLRNGDIKSWDDRIEIIIYNSPYTPGKSKYCIRRNAYKYGLCEKAN